MIRRPPRSTLFPYHDALPISAPPDTPHTRGAPAPRASRRRRARAARRTRTGPARRTPPPPGYRRPDRRRQATAPARERDASSILLEKPLVKTPARPAALPPCDTDH